MLAVQRVNLCMLSRCCVWSYATVEVYGLRIMSVYKNVKVFRMLTRLLFALSVPPAWRHFTSCIYGMVRDAMHKPVTFYRRPNSVTNNGRVGESICDRNTDRSFE